MPSSLCSQPWLTPQSGSQPISSTWLSQHWVTPETLTTQLPNARDWLSRHPGQRYLLCSDDALHFSAALLACWEQGKVVVLPPNNHPVTLTALQKTTDHSVPAQLPNLVAMDSSSCEVFNNPQPRCLDRAALALELHTSGTNGQPLTVLKHFYQLDAELRAHESLWPLASSCVISQVSHLHIYGLLTAILRPICERVPFNRLRAGFVEVLQQRLAEAQQSSSKATVISSPAQLSRMPDSDQTNREQINSRLPAHAPMRIFSSGAPLTEQAAIHCEGLFGCEVIEVYGSTETGGIAKRRQSQTALWTPLPTVSISVVDDCLCLRSEFLEHPSRPWVQADRVRIEGDVFALLGRCDRIAKIGGKRVSLDRVEQVLQDFDSVTQLRCVDLNPQLDRLGMVVAMKAKSLPQTQEERQELQRQMQVHLAKKLDSVSIPRYWRLVRAIPLNSQGKPDRQAIARLFCDLHNRRLPRWLGETRPDANTLLCELEVPMRMSSLEGHFEGFPIVPGVVMVQWACGFAEEAFSPLGDFRRVKRLKFQQILQPGQRVSLRLERQARYIIFSVVSSLGKHCMGQLEFTECSGDDEHE